MNELERHRLLNASNSFDLKEAEIRIGMLEMAVGQNGLDYRISQLESAAILNTTGHDNELLGMNGVGESYQWKQILAGANVTVEHQGNSIVISSTGGVGSGLTSLNGLTADPQSFAKTDDTNVTLTITSATSTHTFALGWTGTLADGRIASASTWNAKENSLTFSAPLARAVNTISIPAASNVANGYLSASDWINFNGKVSQGDTPDFDAITLNVGFNFYLTTSPSELGFNLYSASDSLYLQYDDGGGYDPVLEILATGLRVGTITGATASGGNLSLLSTSNATKGKIYFGTLSVYDHANNRLGINETAPTVATFIKGETIISSLAVSGLTNAALGYEGNISVCGPNSSLNVFRRTVTNLASATAGDRWTFYADAGGFHFWTGTLGDTNIIEADGDWVLNYRLGLGGTSPRSGYLLDFDGVGGISTTGQGTFGGTTHTSANHGVTCYDEMVCLPGATGFSDIQIWKDGTPTRAIAIGMSVPGVAIGDDLVMSTYTGSAWGERLRIANAGGATITSPSSTYSPLRLVTLATNDDPTEEVWQARGTTTNNTQTTLLTYTIPTSNTTMLIATVIARRTGGTAGAAEDGAGYQIMGVYKNTAGTVAVIGAVTAAHTGESQAGWDATFTVSGATVLVRVTGATNNNLTWHVTLRAYRVNS